MDLVCVDKIESFCCCIALTIRQVWRPQIKMQTQCSIIWFEWSKRCFIQISSTQRCKIMYQNKAPSSEIWAHVFSRICYMPQKSVSGRCWLIYNIILKYVCYALEIRYCQFLFLDIKYRMPSYSWENSSNKHIKINRTHTHTNAGRLLFLWAKWFTIGW